MEFSKAFKSDGTFKLSKSEFSQIISNYYQKNYGLNVVFDFLPINYIYNEKHFVYDYDLKMNITIFNQKKIDSYLPCLIEKNSYEYYKRRNIAIPGVIELENLDDEIKKILPKEIIRISNPDIVSIFSELGYSMPLYNWFHDKKTNDIEYSVMVKKINNEEKTKVLEY